MTNGTLSLAALLPALPFKISALNLVDSRSLSRLMTAFGQLRAAKVLHFCCLDVKLTDVSHYMKQRRPHHPCIACENLALCRYNSLACDPQRSQQIERVQHGQLSLRILGCIGIFTLERGYMDNNVRTCVSALHCERQITSRITVH